MPCSSRTGLLLLAAAAAGPAYAQDPPPIEVPGTGCVYLKLPPAAAPGTDEERGCFNDWAQSTRILRKGVPEVSAVHSGLGSDLPRRGCSNTCCLDLTNWRPGSAAQRRTSSARRPCPGSCRSAIRLR